MPNPEDEAIYKRGAWAATFEPETVGQRQRYARDMQAADERVNLRNQQELEALGLRDPKVGRLQLDQKKFDYQKEKDRTAQGLNEDKLSLDERKVKLDERRMTIAEKLEERQIKQAERKTIMEEKMLDQTEKVENGVFEMQEFGLLPGSEGYAAGVQALLKNNPFIDPEYRKVILEDAGVEGDPNEIQSDLARMDPEADFRATAFTDAKGRTRYRFVEAPKVAAKGDPNAPAYKEREYADRQYSRLMKESDQASDDNLKAELRNKARAFGARRDAADQKLQGQGEAPKASAAPSADPDRLKKLLELRNSLQK